VIALAGAPRYQRSPLPWDIERDGSVLHVRLTPPLVDDWEAILEAIHSSLVPRPVAIYLPPAIEGGSATDADMIKLLWGAVESLGIPILRTQE
jgi:hypothetical protein